MGLLQLSPTFPSRGNPIYSIKDAFRRITCYTRTKKHSLRTIRDPHWQPANGTFSSFVLLALKPFLRSFLMAAAYLPSILVPLVGLVFPAIAMASLFLYIEKEEIV